MTAQSKITAARLALTLDSPFFGSLILGLKMVSDPTCKTAWVNGREIGYSPKFVDSLTHDQIVALLTHEVMHVACGHPWRRDNRSHKGWNIACDKAINTELQTSGMTLPPDAYYAEGDEIGKSAEWIYGRMQEQESNEPEPGEQEESDEEQDGQPGGDSESDEDEPGDDDSNEPGEESGDGEPGENEGEGSGEGDSEGEGEGEGEPGDGTGDGTGTGGDFGGTGEVRDAPTGPDQDGDPAPTEQEWKERTAAAALAAQAQGKLPAGMKRLVDQALKPKIDVRSLLLRFFQERSNSDYSWSRPNSRYIAQGMYLPALTTEGLGEVAILCDTSGSIGEIELRKSRAIVESVIEECNPLAVTMYYVDADVCGVDRFEQGEPLDWKPLGGGGTNFCSFFEAVGKLDTPPVCIVGISDLFATFPQTHPSIPVLWMSTTETLQAPFGETVYVGD